MLERYKAMGCAAKEPRWGRCVYSSGQVIRVSIGARCYRHGGGCKGLKSAQQLRRLAMLATMRRASSRVI